MSLFIFGAFPCEQGGFNPFSFVFNANVVGWTPPPSFSMHFHMNREGSTPLHSFSTHFHTNLNPPHSFSTRFHTNGVGWTPLPSFLAHFHVNREGSTPPCLFSTHQPQKRAQALILEVPSLTFYFDVMCASSVRFGSGPGDNLSTQPDLS